jgi:hypothetical protein
MSLCRALVHGQPKQDRALDPECLPERYFEVFLPSYLVNNIVAIQLSEHFVYIENQFFITSYVFTPLEHSSD